ncbi:hypothetical protein MDV049.1 [Gallid alphaherpesvirus 2]|nr:hypothetical protein MDV049.1 [Gallid alphaherpesvirus 2]
MEGDSMRFHQSDHDSWEIYPNVLSVDNSCFRKHGDRCDELCLQAKVIVLVHLPYHHFLPLDPTCFQDLYLSIRFP